MRIIFGCISRDLLRQATIQFVSQFYHQNKSSEESFTFYRQYCQLVEDRESMRFYSRAEHINDCSQILSMIKIELVDSASPIVRAALLRGVHPFLKQLV